MQISKESFEKMNSEVEYLEREMKKERSKKEYLEKMVITFDHILEKIVRAAEGVPLIQDDRSYAMMSNGMHYEQPHRCTPLTHDEVRLAEVEALHDQVLMLAERLAAVKAVAAFAKEHKA